MKLLQRKLSATPKPTATTSEANGDVEPGKDEVAKMTTEQALKSIDKEYFDEDQQEGFDAVRFLLTNGEDLLTLEKVELELARHEKGLQHINQELSATVMNNYTSFVQGMTKVQEVGNDLAMTSILCKNGRKRLHLAQENVIKNGLGVVAKYRKRKALLSVYHILTKLKEIVDREKQLADLLESGDFPSAIQLMSVHRTDLTEWKKLSCVKHLDTNLSAGYEKVIKQIDDALIAVLTQYDPTSYDRILTAYQLLGHKDVVVVGKIKNFVERSADVVSEVVMSLVQRRSKDLEAVVKMKFQELCKNLHFDDILPCLLQIFSVLSDIMHSYYQLYLFHQQRHTNLKGEISDFRKVLWDTIQSKMSLFLGSCEFSHFKIEKFLQVHHAVNMFCELGEEFGESDSHRLRGSLNAKSKTYFMNYHRDILENIRSMVENFESWSRLDASFSLAELPELNHKSYSTIAYSENAQMIRKFLINDSETNPFRTAAENGRWTNEKRTEEKQDSEDEEESEDEDSSSDEDEENESDYEDYEEESPYAKLATTSKSPISPKEKKKKKKRKGRNGPVVTNTSLNIVRRMGVYIQAMEILQADEVFTCFTTLYQFYLYIVYAFFAHIKLEDDHATATNDFMVPEQDTNVSDDLKSSLRQVREALNRSASGSLQSSDDNYFRIPKPSPQVHVHSSSNLYGLVERVTSAESLESLMEVVTKVCAKMKTMMTNSSKQEHVEEFLRTMGKLTHEVKQVVYSRIVRKIFMRLASTNSSNQGDYPNQIEKSKWIVSRITGEHNKYVNNIMKDLETFRNQLEPFTTEEEEKNVNHQVPKIQIPIQSVDQIWDSVIKFIMLELIEGFSRVKKCNEEGRAQMGLDLSGVTQGIQKIAPLTVCKPVPYTHIVKNYIQGYYIPASDMLDWVRANYDPHYNAKQIKALIEVGPCAQLPKKQKQDLLTEIDRIYYQPESDTSKSMSTTTGVSQTSPIDKNEFWSMFKTRITMNDNR